jgi:hypothetical protein
MKPSPIAVRRAVAVAACVAVAGLLAACGSSPSPSAHATVTITVTAPTPSGPATSPAITPSQAPTPAGPPGCATAALTAALGPGGAAAGSSYRAIEFTNSSSSTCSLYGYPGISFVTAAGVQVGAAATEDPTYPRQLVTLTPGDTVHAELRITDALNYPSSTCHPVAVHRLKIFPPGQTGALFLAQTATACSNTAVPILAVQTIQPGSGTQ